jgi:cytidylate kinase
MNSPAAHRIIAIDGPAASGKSSVARELARRLRFVYANSGAVYRALTWLALERGVSPNDSLALAQLAADTPLEFSLRNGESVLLINNIDPEPFLRENRVNNAVSLVSRVPQLREIVVAHLRRLAEFHDLVMEGRDIGSVVFPRTPYKFYIDASPEVRAQRRLAQGEHDSITARDRADSSRETSPLVISQDAEVIDSSNLTIEGVIHEILGRLKEKGLTTVS